ncbi:MAG: hypothetical protein WBL99_15065 [Candidatus Acidiferrales bacterium]
MFIESRVESADSEFDPGLGKSICGCLPDSRENISLARIESANAWNDRNHAEWTAVSLQEFVYVPDKPSLERAHADRTSTTEASIVRDAIPELFCECDACRIPSGMALQPLNQKIAICDGFI